MRIFLKNTSPCAVLCSVNGGVTFKVEPSQEISEEVCDACTVTVRPIESSAAYADAYRKLF